MNRFVFDLFSLFYIGVTKGYVYNYTKFGISCNWSLNLDHFIGLGAVELVASGLLI